MTKKMNKYNGKKLSRGEPPNFSGQHFMHNKRLLKEIVDKAEVSVRDTVLELGAGKGALTTILSERANQVLAIEYDQKCIEALQWKLVGSKNVSILHQDIMKVTLPTEPFVVVSNIPYAITTAIMKMLLNNPKNKLQRGAIVMEKGAAKRFTSVSPKDAYVMAWHMWFDIHYERGISRSAFSPPPKVDSALVRIVRKPHPLFPYKEAKAMHDFLSYALNNPRAPLDQVLRGIFTAPQAKKVRQAIGVKPETPVAMLHARQWAIVCDAMVRHVPKVYWPRRKR
ncbi:ribosomal RNA small subunit methyltransferase A [Shouchella clausii]|uniref:23S ribosomal RNA methyltransferase Erm n=1 Tax=Shouchella tritolerans TaxID=2979466 RepID=UPI001AFFC2E4|nr:23S ribosomal RNA methyltransferase Erm [Shouchella tritolerans]GIN12476.1 ribosomal RNA small subunit methyltransferase A [Shouchella clausii]